MRGAQRTERNHGAYQVDHNAPPTQDATRTLGFGVGLGSAACRGEVYKASTAVGEDKSGSSERRLMDSVVAPYRLELALERLVDTNVECIPEMTLIEQRKGSDCSRKWG